MSDNKINQWISNDLSIKMDMINRMVDLFDEATMKFYYASINEDIENTDITNYNNEHPSINFYESLIRVIDYFLDGKPLNIDDDANREIDEILETFRLDVEENGINTEEIRRALLLLDIKAFKNINFSLDIITPDTIGIIFSQIIKSCFDNLDDLVILDPNFGIGNLMFTINNHLGNKIKMIGMENHELLVRVAASKANMLMEDLTIYYQDALEYQLHNINAVVSDLAVYDYINDGYQSELYNCGVRYFPYLAIEKDILSNEKHISFYLINNNFFQLKDSKLFNTFFNKYAHIECLIVLPSTMFVNDSEAKSILIITNKPSINKDMHIFMLPSLNNMNKFIEKLDEIKHFLKELKD